MRALTSSLSLVATGLAGLLALAEPGPALGAAGTPAARIRWEASFATALRKARTAQKPIMVDFWADWCGWCHTFDRTTYVDPEVVRLSRDFVTVKVDTEGSPAEMEAAMRYRVASLPTVLFLAPTGRVVFRLSGYQRPEEFARTLAMVKAEAARVAALEQAIARQPKDARALMELGLHLLDNESFEEGRDFLSQALAADGELPGTDRKRLRYALGIVRRLERKYAEAETLLKEGLALSPADAEADPQILYALGRLYMAWGRANDATAALQRLIAEFPESPIADHARRTLALVAPSP